MLKAQLAKIYQYMYHFNQLPKLRVAGSNPVYRSKVKSLKINRFRWIFNGFVISFIEIHVLRIGYFRAFLSTFGYNFVNNSSTLWAFDTK